MRRPEIAVLDEPADRAHVPRIVLARAIRLFTARQLDPPVCAANLTLAGGFIS